MTDRALILIALLAGISACSGGERAREVEALRLLGNATGGAVTARCSRAGASELPMRLVSTTVVDHSLAESLHAAAERIRAEAPECTTVSASFGVTGRATIAQIRNILGPEGSSEPGEVSGSFEAGAITMYRYDWLGFGADSNGNVVAMDVKFKG